MKHLLQELYGGDARDAYENAVISLHSLERRRKIMSLYHWLTWLMLFRGN